MGERKPTTIFDTSSCADKTTFLLDRSTYFTHVSSGLLINGDCLKDAKKTTCVYANLPPIPSFDRSLWTCTVEAVIGYSRLVWDIFTPDQRCISILTINPNSDNANDPSKHIDRICTWRAEDQNLDYLMKSLAKKSHNYQLCPPLKLQASKDIASYPNCDSESVPMISSLNECINDLCRPTKVQVDRASSNKSNSKGTDSKVDNRGRLILISSFKDEANLMKLLNKFKGLLKAKNEQVQRVFEKNSEEWPITHCDLVIVNTFPIDDEGTCSKIANFELDEPGLYCKVFSVRSGRNIAGLLNNLCLQHHNLRSTTITGIPMKEEQNASSSSQYDVEIVHSSSIHDDILNSDNPLLDGVTAKIDRNGFLCDTFKLSWCTPRSTTVELNHCIATSRITAVDINSRPSACLTNFLLNGRSVMLEIFKSKSNRMTTHILSSHGGELFIHSLATVQQKFNISDPPSINDQLGGKVGDYRTSDFVAFMKQHTLCRSHLSEDPLDITCNLIRRQTLYWPLTLGHTILLNVGHLMGAILRLIPKDTLDQSEVDECKKSIDELAKFEKEGQALPSVTIPDLVKTSNSKSGDTRLEQLYKLLHNELEYFLRVHSITPEHESVLEYWLDRNCDKKANSERGTKRATNKTVSSPHKKVKITNQLIPEISDSNTSLQQNAFFYRTGLTLWQTWTQLYHQFHKTKNKLPFVGRSQV